MMRRTTLLALPLMLLVIPVQDPKRKPVSIEFKTELKKNGKFYSFVFEGKTNLPAGTLLRITAYYPEEYERPGPEGQPPVKDVIGDYMFLHDYEAKLRIPDDGAIRVDLYRIKRKPFSLPYTGRIQFLVEDQDPEVMQKIRDSFQFEAKIEKYFNFNFGNPKDFDAECVESAASLEKDGHAVEEMVKQLQATYLSQKAKFDMETWLKFKDDYTLRVRRLQDRNEDRFTMFKYFLERKGKFYVQDLTDSLLFINEACERILRDPSNAEHQEDLNKKLKDFDELLAQFREELDLDKPDADKLKKPIEALAKPALSACERAAKAIEGNAFEWEQAREVIREVMTQAAFQISDEKVQTTKKIHPFVVDVLSAFTELADATDAYLKDKKDDAKKSVQERADALKKAVAELKTFAGLKE